MAARRAFCRAISVT